MSKRLQLLALSLFLLSLATLGHVQAKTALKVATYELHPYVGSQLEQLGATSEIVSAALQQTPYSADISFYKAARAKELAIQGLVDAVFPAVYDAELSSKLVYSDAIPGIKVGLLRKKTGQPHSSLTLVGKSIGIVRGAIPPVISKRFTGATFHEKANNQILLKMLMADRLDFILINKFTAADLMVDQYPEMIGQLEFVESTTLSVDFHLAFSRSFANAENLAAQFNRNLNQLIASGDMQKIYYQHGLSLFTASKGKQVLRVATVANNEMLTMQKLANLYQFEHPNIQFEWHVLDENILRRRLLSELAIGKGQYDVMTIGAYEAATWAKRGWLTPIANLPDDYLENDIITSIRDSLTFDGHMTALPFYGETSVTYYRTDLFATAGLSMASHPSYDDILRYAKAIHNPQAGTYGICLRGKPGWGENIALLSTMANAYGGQWFDMQWQPQLTTEAWQKALSRYHELLVNYGPPIPEEKGYKQNLQLFAAGKCGIWIDASVAAGTLFSPTTSTVSNSVAMAPAPKAITSKGSSWLWTWSLAVPSSSKLKPEALEFIAWATSPAYIQLVAQMSGWIAVPPGTRHSTYASEKYRAAAPFSPDILEYIENATPFDNTLPPSPYSGIQFAAIAEFPAIGTQVGLQAAQVLRGEKTVEQALLAAQRFVQAKMRLANYHPQDHQDTETDAPSNEQDK
ncbi:extracellular solute-binding protein [Neiella marina]|uniref:Extracellular solute-binding protein n=1 Tax=Neiella holothuriorum TaxID=2870530 RepID=A0ABS7EKQ5_9GAMM|nr:extracellular solute-binding protein [Neiella holothuriorum]MBW8192356.1 extracellular solute-binding protein [Neiella holothuriorum]